ncbi:hypothetical protein F5I97DRAFT_1876876 [Phlebopus sp. FC_14]|nr:hypothetical protein F5I97DRAFT_1876876 [Phlebopus sp. FC_14]
MSSPPVPFADFECPFDPSLSSLFPAPSASPLPPSADLFSPAETTDLLGFLDNFNWDWDAHPSPPATLANETPQPTSSRPKNTQPRVKPLLSTPQKRLNHIMSEQKRRNAIRDGYAHLIALIAPAGAQSIHLPARGRPKGSGSRAKGHSKGKSGVLFRAVEYCRWLEQGTDALKQDVFRLEAAAGIPPSH